MHGLPDAEPTEEKRADLTANPSRLPQSKRVAALSGVVASLVILSASEWLLVREGAIFDYWWPNGWYFAVALVPYFLALALYAFISFVIFENATIFISYRRADAIHQMDAIAQRLRAHFGAKNVLYDIAERGIEGIFPDWIKRGVATCDYFIAVIGSSWLTATDAGQRRLDDPRDWVRIEIELALGRRIPLIPVVLEGVSMPTPDQLPDTLKAFALHNSHRVHDPPDLARDVESLISKIVKHEVQHPRWPRRCVTKIRRLSPIKQCVAWAAALLITIGAAELAIYQSVSLPANVVQKLEEREFKVDHHPKTPRSVEYVEITAPQSYVPNFAELAHLLSRIKCEIRLTFENCDRIESFSGLESGHIVKLRAVHCTNMRELWRPGALPALRTLDLSQSQSLTHLDGCCNLAQLKVLVADRCKGLTDLSGLKGVPHLKALDLTECSKLVSVAVGEDLTELTHLFMCRCGKLQTLEKLRLMPQLEHLDISRCECLSSLTSLPEMANLKTVVVRRDPGLKDVANLRRLPLLKAVYVDSSLEDLVTKSIGANKVTTDRPPSPTEAIRDLSL
jgi:hypothetical protein